MADQGFDNITPIGASSPAQVQQPVTQSNNAGAPRAQRHGQTTQQFDNITPIGASPTSVSAPGTPESQSNDVGASAPQPPSADNFANNEYANVAPLDVPGVVKGFFKTFLRNGIPSRILPAGAASPEEMGMSGMHAEAGLQPVTTDQATYDQRQKDKTGIINEARKQTETHGYAEDLGRLMDSALELMGMTKVAKGMGVVDAVDSLANTIAPLKSIAKSPVILSLLKRGLQGAAEGATLTGTQEAMHGGDWNDVGSAAKTGAIAGGLGGAVVGGIEGAGLKAAMPTVANKPVTAVEAKVAKGVAGAKLETDSPGYTTYADMPEKVNADIGLDPDVPLFVSRIERKTLEPQESINSNISRAAAVAAKNSGVEVDPTITLNANVRDHFANVSREVLASSKADFQVLDDASGGRWQRYSDRIRNLQSKMDEVADVDEDLYGKLRDRRLETEATQAQLIELMKAEGKVDPAIADRANANWKAGMAQEDVSNAARTSTKQVVVDGKVQTITDPDGFANRLQKLNDTPSMPNPDGSAKPSRLTQAFSGDKDAADKFVRTAGKDQELAQAIKDFVPQLPEGRTAMQNLIANNTIGYRTRILGTEKGKTDWSGVAKEFDMLGSDKQQVLFKEELPQVCQYIKTQALKQLWGTGAKWAGRAVVALPVPSYVGVKILHNVLSGDN